MTGAQELARTLVARSWFRPDPRFGWRHVGAYSDGVPLEWTAHYRRGGLPDAGHVLDLSDAATAGILLEMLLPHPHGYDYDPRATAECRWTVQVWCGLEGGQDAVAYGSSLGEATARALLEVRGE